MTVGPSQTKGFSLLELVAVLAIFAVVALIGVQVMQSTLRSSERLTDISEQSREIAVALSLLRQDLGNAVPRAFIPPGGGQQPALVQGQGGFALSVGGLARLDPGASGFGRVIWRYDPTTDQLLRRVWTSLNPGDPRAASPEITVLSGVNSVALFSYDVQGGWRPGFASDPGNPSVLPLGVRLRIDHTRAEALDVTVSLR
jgi:general secretion pathway protein J